MEVPRTGRGVEGSVGARGPGARGCSLGKPKEPARAGEAEGEAPGTHSAADAPRAAPPRRASALCRVFWATSSARSGP